MYARNESGGLVHANDHGHGEQHKVPTNERLWKMIILQAKMRFRTYPSPGASHWVHVQYVKHGGQFAVVSEDTRRKKLEIKRYQEKKREAMAQSERSKEHEEKHKKGGHGKNDKKD
jgi:hypothetical protein